MDLLSKRNYHDINNRKEKCHIILQTKLTFLKKKCSRKEIIGGKSKLLEDTKGLKLDFDISAIHLFKIIEVRSFITD